MKRVESLDIVHRTLNGNQSVERTLLRVFLYKDTYRKDAEQLRAQLKQAGIPCYLAEGPAIPNAYIPERISRHKECRKNGVVFCDVLDSTLDDADDVTIKEIVERKYGACVAYPISRRLLPAKIEQSLVKQSRVIVKI